MLPDETPIADVRSRFSVRVQNRLETMGLKTVGEVRHTTDREFLGAGNFGRKSLRELRMELGPYVPPDEEPAGNGRDEAAYEPADPASVAAALAAACPGPLVSPKPVPGPALAKIFVAAVENGYIIRPAYSDGYKGAGDDRSWVVGNRQALAAMVSWLVADRGKASPDMLGGPIHMPQPEAHYAPPIGVEAADV